MAGGSSLSLRGRSIAIPNDRERNADPARLLRLCFAKRPKGRSIFAAPFGASCEKCPPIRPYMVVAPLLGHRFATRLRLGGYPKGAARRRLGSAFALQNANSAATRGESRRLRRRKKSAAVSVLTSSPETPPRFSCPRNPLSVGLTFALSCGRGLTRTARSVRLRRLTSFGLSGN